jgi:serine/threonine-protein kinase
VVDRLIGQSALGAVYQGRDQTSDQRVAIRLIVPEFDNDDVAAFVERDVRTAGQLANKHVARLINIGFLPTGERCVISEFVEGETLASRVKREGRLREAQVAGLLTQLLDGLAAAHRAGVFHRDLTPNSIVIGPSAEGQGDHATLIDFGICRLQALTGNASAAKSAGLEAASLQYLSPEQLNGLRELDARSNIYSLGAIAYQAVAGKRPFEGNDFSDPSAVVLQNEPTPVEELAPESSSPFAQMIRKAMARSPNARFQSADEMGAAIATWSDRAKSAPATAHAPAFTPPMPSSVTRPAAVAPVASSAAEVMAPPPLPPDEALAQMAPGEPRAVQPPVAAQEATSAAAPEMVPPPLPPAPEIQLPASARVAAVLAAASATPPPPPPPMDPTAADIDQSVVDALFAPPPMPADADLPGADDWEGVSQAPEPKSAPISELQPPRLDPAPSRPSSPAAAAPSSPFNRPPMSTPRTAVVVPSVNTEPATVRAAAVADAAAAVSTTVITGAEAVATISNPENGIPSSRPSISSAPTQPYATLPDEIEEATREKRTILGLGGYGNYPLPAESSSPVASSSSPVQEAPQSHRPPQGTVPGIHPTPDAAELAESASVPQRQQETQQVVTSATPVSGLPVAVTSAAMAPSAPPAQPVPESAATVQLANATGPSTAPAVSAAPVQQASAGAQPKAVAAVVPSVSAADALDDLGPYGKSRSRSRKPLIAILLVGLVGAGAAFALLQGHAEEPQRKPASSHASEVVSPPRAPEPQPVKPAPTPNAESQTEAAAQENTGNSGKSGASLSQAVNSGLLSHSVAAAQGKKPATVTSASSKPAVTEKTATEKTVAEKPTTPKPTTPKPTVVSKPVTKSVGAVTTPSKPAASKPGKDPYNYR